MPNCRQDRIIIKRNILLLVFGVVALHMADQGLDMLQLYHRRGDSLLLFQTIYKITIVSVWTLFEFVMGVFCIRSGMVQLCLDEEGVHLCSLFREKELLWNQVQDWGIACDSARRIDSKICYMYFSPHQLPVRGEKGEKYTRQVIRVVVLQRDLEHFRQDVLPFCAAHINCAPFDAGPKELG